MLNGNDDNLIWFRNYSHEENLTSELLCYNLTSETTINRRFNDIKIYDISFIPATNNLFVIFSDCIVNIFSLKENKIELIDCFCISDFWQEDNFSPHPIQLSISPSGKLLAASRNNELIMWDINDIYQPTSQRKIALSIGEEINHLMFGFDNNFLFFSVSTLLSEAEKNFLYVIDVRNWQIICMHDELYTRINSIHISSEYAISTIYSDNSFKIWKFDPDKASIVLQWRSGLLLHCVGAKIELVKHLSPENRSLIEQRSTQAMPYEGNSCTLF